MVKADKTIIKETKYIAVCVLITSVLLQAVFLILKAWDYTVLLGNLLTAIAAVLNFFFMGITVQKALTKDEADAKKLMRSSQSIRSFGMFLVIVLGVVLPCFNTLAVILTVFFPRLAIFIRPLVKGKDKEE